uniref:WH2 domain-containing protein n=1 Tax=Meloidogyne javanica TaxID=6303 RepID=A0A915LU84_MELJA
MVVQRSTQQQQFPSEKNAKIPTTVIPPQSIVAENGSNKNNLEEEEISVAETIVLPSKNTSDRLDFTRNWLTSGGSDMSGWAESGGGGENSVPKPYSAKGGTIQDVKDWDEHSLGIPAAVRPQPFRPQLGILPASLGVSGQMHKAPSIEQIRFLRAASQTSNDKRRSFPTIQTEVNNQNASSNTRNLTNRPAFETINQERINPSKVDAMAKMFDKQTNKTKTSNPLNFTTNGDSTTNWSSRRTKAGVGVCGDRSNGFYDNVHNQHQSSPPPPHPSNYHHFRNEDIIDCSSMSSREIELPPQPPNNNGISNVPKTAGKRIGQLIKKLGNSVGGDNKQQNGISAVSLSLNRSAHEQLPTVRNGLGVKEEILTKSNSLSSERWRTQAMNQQQNVADSSYDLDEDKSHASGGLGNRLKQTILGGMVRRRVPT